MASGKEAAEDEEDDLAHEGSGRSLLLLNHFWFTWRRGMWAQCSPPHTHVQPEATAVQGKCNHIVSAHNQNGGHMHAKASRTG